MKWLRKKAYDLSANEDASLSYAEEAIDYIQSGGGGLELILDLIAAIREEDVREVSKCLQEIRKDESSIFDDGVYHLPKQNLGELIQDIISLGEEIVDEGGIEEEEEEGTTNVPGSIPMTTPEAPAAESTEPVVEV